MTTDDKSGLRTNIEIMDKSIPITRLESHFEKLLSKYNLQKLSPEAIKVNAQILAWAVKTEPDKFPVAPDVDEWGQVQNNAKNALWVRKKLQEGYSIAIPLSLGNMTMFHISFMPLRKAIPVNTVYSDGSSGGIQVNIDRIGTYSIPLGSAIGEEGYLNEKWKINSPVDAKALLPFFNTVFTGTDYFKKEESNG